MGYHNIRLPETFSAGSLFGPGFKTLITETDGGTESRIQRYPPAGRRLYNLARGIAGLDSLMLLISFFTARGGAENTWRLKDWLDYATTPSWTTHRDSDASVTATDVLIGVGDGVTTQFQLVKRYTSGPTTIVRTIRKPIASTVLVSVNDTPTSSGWTVNDETGIITFTSPPAADSEIKAGCEYDVPCRFDEETDKALQIAIEAVESGSLPAIMAVEDLDPVTASQERNYGGAYDHGSISANLQLSELHGLHQTVNPTAGGLKLFMPLPQETGGPVMVIKNRNGSNSITVRNQGDTATLVVLTAGSSAVIWLGYDTTTKTWYATA